VNCLKVAMKHAILGLLERGWSERRIARELGVNRRTVRRYARLAAAGQSAPNPTPGSSGPESLCEPFREIVLAKLEAGLTAQRIWQDLAAEHGFEASYQSVKRFCRRLGAKRELPFRRIEVEPGAERQVDFGKGAPVMTSRGRRRRPHVLRAILSFSRRGYSLGVWKQATDEFLGALEDSFRHFGGVPRTVVLPDPLRGEAGLQLGEDDLAEGLAEALRAG
jgi:transposase